jgi:hypothetical protein
MMTPAISAYASEHSKDVHVILGETVAPPACHAYVDVREDVQPVYYLEMSWLGTRIVLSSRVPGHETIRAALEAALAALPLAPVEAGA